jgi:hypothetical protein
MRKLFSLHLYVPCRWKSNRLEVKKKRKKEIEKGKERKVRRNGKGEVYGIYNSMNLRVWYL